MVEHVSKFIVFVDIFGGMCLARLADIGILTAMQPGRDKLFIHRALLDLLAG